MHDIALHMQKEDRHRVCVCDRRTERIPLLESIRSIIQCRQRSCNINDDHNMHYCDHASNSMLRDWLDQNETNHADEDIDSTRLAFLTAPPPSPAPKPPSPPDSATTKSCWVMMKFFLKGCLAAVIGGVRALRLDSLWLGFDMISLLKADVTKKAQEIKRRWVVRLLCDGIFGEAQVCRRNKVFQSQQFIRKWESNRSQQ